MSYISEPGPLAAIPAERLAALLDAALDLAEAHDLTTMLRRMVERAVTVAHSRYAALGIYEDGKLTMFMHHGVDPDTVDAIGQYPEGRELLTALAALAASALDNARLGDVERERAEALMRLGAAEELAAVRREMLERVIDAQEAERARVARDLHDQVGQSLTSVLLALQLAATSPPGSNEGRQRIEELRELITDTLHEVRRVAFDLRPAVLDDIGLVTAVQRLADSLDTRLGLRVTVDVTGIDDAERLPGETETQIYRIVQEALTNVARHAQVDAAAVILRASNGSVRVEIHDSGQGFDLDSIQPSLGLGGMTERAALAGATLSIESARGSGTRIILSLGSPA